MTPCLFLLCLFPTGRSISLGRKHRRGRCSVMSSFISLGWSRRPAWPLFLLHRLVQRNEFLAMPHLKLAMDKLKCPALCSTCRISLLGFYHLQQRPSAMVRYTSIEILSFEQVTKKGSTYMFLERNATSMASLNFLIVALELHTFFLYGSPSVFNRTGGPFSAGGLVLIVMISNSCLIGFVRLIIPNYGVIRYVHPRYT
jgi:hypothetical protein